MKDEYINFNQVKNEMPNDERYQKWCKKECLSLRKNVNVKKELERMWSELSLR